MRITLRCLLATISVIESTIGELHNGHPGESRFAEIAKSIRNVRRAIAEILDDVIDKGEE